MDMNPSPIMGGQRMMLEPLKPLKNSLIFLKQNDMVQATQQTDEEKMAMYMKLPKKQIIKMLIQCNKILDLRQPILEYTCGDCGEKLTLVRHGKHQCDN